MCSLHTTTHPSVATIKLWPTMRSNGNCRLKMHVSQCEPSQHVEIHTAPHKHKQEDKGP